MTNTDSDNSREWAAQAYALLKKRQEDQKKELEKQEDQKKELEKQEDQKKELIDMSNNENTSRQSKTFEEPQLGEFDDNFTWSAMVLASQGKKFINGVLRRLQTI